MNNKGFAITGIIYTLFVIFLLVLLSVLSNLNSFKRLITSSIESFEDSFEGEKVELQEEEISNINNAINGGEGFIVTYKGKYIFKLKIPNEETLANDSDYNEILCSSYLNKGNEIELINVHNVVFHSKDCNKRKDNAKEMNLVEIYSFEGDN